MIYLFIHTWCLKKTLKMYKYENCIEIYTLQSTLGKSDIFSWFGWIYI